MSKEGYRAAPPQSSAGRERESGLLRGAHAVTRLLMLLQLEIEAEVESGR